MKTAPGKLSVLTGLLGLGGILGIVATVRGQAVFVLVGTPVARLAFVFGTVAAILLLARTVSANEGVSGLGASVKFVKGSMAAIVASVIFAVSTEVRSASLALALACAVALGSTWHMTAAIKRIGQKRRRHSPQV